MGPAATVAQMGKRRSRWHISAASRKISDTFNVIDGIACPTNVQALVEQMAAATCRLQHPAEGLLQSVAVFSIADQGGRRPAVSAHLPGQRHGQHS